MRVLIVTQYFEPEVGAPQVRLANFTRQLRSQGHDVEIVTSMPNYPDGVIFDGYRKQFRSTETWSQDPDVLIHRVWLKAGGGRGVGRLVGFASFAAMLPFAMAKAKRPDLVFVNSPLLNVAPIALAAAKKWKAKTVLCAADLWPDSLFDMMGTPSPLLARPLYWLERQIYERCDAIAAVTEGIQTTLLEEKKVDPAKVTFLPNGVDLDFFSPHIEGHRPEALQQVTGPLFAFPGTIGYFNGLDVVLDAMEILATSRPDIHFAFVGDGPERARLETMRDDRGLSNVTFTGSVTPGEVATLLPTLTAGVVCLRDLPVTRGARPAKTFPILAAALPVIFVGVGEGPALIERAGAGVSVAPEDGPGLAAAMIQIADDPEQAKAYGSSGRDYVREHLSWQGIVRSWLQALKAAIPDLPHSDTDSIELPDSSSDPQSVPVAAPSNP